MNETLKVMEERSSCMAFTNEMPEKEILATIAKAGLESPSGTNTQPWRIIIVTNQSIINEMEEETLNMMSKLPAYKGLYDVVIAKGMKLFYNAPCMIILPYDKKIRIRSYLKIKVFKPRYLSCSIQFITVYLVSYS